MRKPEFDPKLNPTLLVSQIANALPIHVTTDPQMQSLDHWFSDYGFGGHDYDLEAEIAKDFAISHSLLWRGDDYQLEAIWAGAGLLALYVSGPEKADEDATYVAAPHTLADIAAARIKKRIIRDLVEVDSSDRIDRDDIVPTVGPYCFDLDGGKLVGRPVVYSKADYIKAAQKYLLEFAGGKFPQLVQDDLLVLLYAIGVLPRGDTHDWSTELAQAGWTGDSPTDDDFFDRLSHVKDGKALIEPFYALDTTGLQVIRTSTATKGVVFEAVEREGGVWVVRRRDRAGYGYGKVATVASPEEARDMVAAELDRLQGATYRRDNMTVYRVVGEGATPVYEALLQRNERYLTRRMMPDGAWAPDQDVGGRGMAETLVIGELERLQARMAPEPVAA